MQRNRKVLLAAAVACAAPLASAQARYDRIAVPGSGITIPNGVNDSGMVVGATGTNRHEPDGAYRLMFKNAQTHATGLSTSGLIG